MRDPPVAEFLSLGFVHPHDLFPAEGDDDDEESSSSEWEESEELRTEEVEEEEGRGG